MTVVKHRSDTYRTAMTVAKHRSDIKLTTYTPYLTLMGELWGVCCMEIGENWLHYKDTTLYCVEKHHVIKKFASIWNIYLVESST